MSFSSLVIVLGYAIFGQPAASAEAFIVRDGKANAEIVIAGNPPRTVMLAADELRSYVEKISGAKLSITNAPGNGVPVKIYVGQSAHTDKLGIKPYDIKDGGYRMVSGDKWLALIGRDDDFTPIEPWPRRRSAEVIEQWDKLTGNAKWGNPMGGFFKSYSGQGGSIFNFGKPDFQPRDQNDAVCVWAFDERGSFNAVCDFLRRLGVRWFMPGEIGEVLPTMSSIPLPRLDETIRPDFPIRRFNFNFAGSHDVTMWAMRLGIRDPYGVMTAHGINTLTGRPEFQAAHPDYFALYGGKRNNTPESHYHQPCLSSEGLFQETVRWARTVFDHYKFETVDVMPPDAFVSMCQCPKCEGKDTLERGRLGRMSDYVWDYVNRVAEETAKTHPNKKISCCAYGPYTLPPLKIDKLNSNVVVIVVGGREPFSSRPEQRDEIRKFRESWIEKTDNKILVFENYPFTLRGFYLPAFCHKTIGASINETRGFSQGEDIWTSQGGAGGLPQAGWNHFTIYFTARMYWEKDADALFDDYCRMFYVPAEKEMRAFFEYCEANWQDMEKDKEKTMRALNLFAEAEKKADVQSIYGRRIAIVADYLKPLKSKSQQLQVGRGPVPEFRLAPDADGIRIDGKLDDEFWQKCPYFANGSLAELETGRKPAFGTSFKAAWGNESIYLAIRCEDRPGAPLNIGTKRNEDAALWDGDAIEILLETDTHSYYQISINPAGAIVNIDRLNRKNVWDSMAEVATEVGDGFWTIEIRIPVVEKTNDPLHQVDGRKPTDSLPWYFNVCRQRLRQTGSEFSAFSPTGTKTFHDVMKFGKLYMK